MTGLLRAVSAAALAGTIVPAVLYLRGSLDLGTMQVVMAVATAAWFASAPFWMKAD